MMQNGPITTPLGRSNAIILSTWGLWSYPNHSLNPLDHTHRSSYIASYIASSLHHHSMYHMCMDIPVFMAGIGFQTKLYYSNL